MVEYTSLVANLQNMLDYTPEAMPPVLAYLVDATLCGDYGFFKNRATVQKLCHIPEPVHEIRLVGKVSWHGLVVERIWFVHIYKPGHVEGCLV